MEELVLSSYIKIMQESFSKNNKQESAARFLLNSILSQEAVWCGTDFSSKKISNIVNRKDPVPEDIVIASTKEDVIISVHAYFSEYVMKEINPHLRLDVLDKIAQLVQRDSVISTMKKEELLSLFGSEEYDVFLADVFLYVIGRNNKISKEPDNRNEKRLLYRSSLISDKKGVMFLNDTNIKSFSEAEDTRSNDIYRLEAYFSFDSQYDDDGRRIICAQAIIGNVNIIGTTSSENWLSRSYMNNVTKVNSIFCTTVFKVLEVTSNNCRVQYLAIGDEI
ncbi:hypothetical protein [uncultured Tyzzerella sp.]|uniref:hypothetical protein n=1 Tax=uncultured Tyzzerella sp. TaxID=2321398 RepID=UPI0029425164|nr:hypothetical protein [uncultured Tyzzerella sp.]